MNKEAWQDASDDINLEIDPKLKVTGAALCSMSQNQAYKALWEKSLKKLAWRPKTVENMKITIQEAQDRFSKRPTEAALWRLFQHRDIDCSTKYFLWMAMYKAYRVRPKWLHFTPEYYKPRGLQPTKLTYQVGWLVPGGFENFFALPLYREMRLSWVSLMYYLVYKKTCLVISDL